MRLEVFSAILIQRQYRGYRGRQRARAERDKYIFSKSQSQGIEFGRQMLLEHKLHATRLQSEVSLLTADKVAAEEQVEALLEEISEFEEGVRALEKEMHQLTKIEADAASFMSEESKHEVRQQKMRLDAEFGHMLARIGDRKEHLIALEKKLSALDKARQGKEEQLHVLERKLVVLLEEQQRELEAIKRRQEKRGDMLSQRQQLIMGSQSSNQLAVICNDSASGSYSGPSLQEKRQAAQLMQSTETLMKFGFMSMSMTYFSSLNMVRALRTVAAQDTVMAAVANVALNQNGLPITSEHAAGSTSATSMGKMEFKPRLKPGQLPGQEALRVSAWSVEDVARWLETLSLGQYCESFIDGAVDGEFLYDLNDDVSASTQQWLVTLTPGVLLFI
jgi:hypothetical protein